MVGYMKIGFVGLGQMGKGMALNLAQKGCDLLAYDVRDTAFAQLGAKGVRTTPDARDMARMDLLFLCLPNESVVESFLLGENGVLPHMDKGKIVVDCSTIGYLDTLRIANEVESRGVRFMDAPVSGMQARAEDGTLSMMCGGREELFDFVKPYLDRMGASVILMGPVGSGQLTKMVNNCIYDANVAAVSEVLAMAVKLGLNPEKIGRAVNEGTGRSYASEYFIPRMLKGDFAYGFTMKSAYKDLVNASAIAAQNVVPMPVLDAVTCVYRMALCTGQGELYKGAMIKVYEELLGVKFREEGSAQ